jgi:phytoene synthase
VSTPDHASALSRHVLRRHARTFSWAARLLPARLRQDATMLYAWCRRCDDAVDHAPDEASARAAVARLRRELDLVYGATPVVAGDPGDASWPILAGLQEVVRRTGLPRGPADELLDGMEMDLGPVRYGTFAELLVYCHRVAGTVGLLMAHLMGVCDRATLRQAADLGIAMQLTNICRDVIEDEARGRVYVPAELLGAAVAPSADAARTRAAVAELLRRADGHYRRADGGIRALPASCALAIRAARLIYAEIGATIASRGFDVTRGRAVVSGVRKLWLVVRAVCETAASRLSPRRTSP